MSACGLLFLVQAQGASFTSTGAMATPR